VHCCGGFDEQRGCGGAIRHGPGRAARPEGRSDAPFSPPLRAALLMLLAIFAVVGMSAGTGPSAAPLLRPGA
jgi:hypothetical protein